MQRTGLGVTRIKEALERPDRDRVEAAWSGSPFAIALRGPPPMEEFGVTGVRVPDEGTELLPRAHYNNVIAADYAKRGYTHFAEIIEAGHACAACHLTHGLNVPPTNAELDLGRYAVAAVATKVTREVVEMLASMSMGSKSPSRQGVSSTELVSRRACRSQATGVPFDAAKLERIQQNLERQGVSFVTGEEGKRLANALGGEAVYIPEAGRPGIIAWGPQPSRAAVVEELLHLGQHRRAGWADVSAAIPRLEIEAQEKLLRLGARRGWLESELSEIARALARWREQL